VTGDRAVDSAAALYARAGERAAMKRRHHGRAGELQLDYEGYRPICGGQLRTAYVRRLRERGYPRKTEWVPVAIVCEGCTAWWPKPRAEATA
jgi:hypothetical protein